MAAMSLTAGIGGAQEVVQHKREQLLVLELHPPASCFCQPAELLMNFICEE